jgi:hypothetical protein
MSPAPPAEHPPDDRSVASRVCDIVRYAPLAILLDGPSLLPQLAEQGKEHMRNARALGPVALRRAERHLRSNFGDLGTQAADLLRATGLVTARAPAPRPGAAEPASPAAASGASGSPGSTSPASPADGDRAPGGGTGAGSQATTAVDEAPAGGGEPAEPAAPSAEGLAIPDYDSLSAMQVVNRLPGLAADELAAVRHYEASHRGRKTILNRVAQLQHG